MLGEPSSAPRRAMVQARQIYTLRTALERGWAGDSARETALRAAAVLVDRYRQPSGAIAHAIGNDGINLNPDLYAQAFAIFGMASAYALDHQPVWKQAALDVLSFLKRERALPAGGYSELRAGHPVLEANPHMHLFEAALAWLDVEPAPEWRDLADEIAELARTKFVDFESGMLCEFFDQGWSPRRLEGRFVVEPGHQYEWAWLFARYEKLSGHSASVRVRLCEASDRFGLRDGITIDEIWSDGSVKSASARFWPQSERVKATVTEGREKDAREALQALSAYFATPTAGMWFDRRDASGRLVEEPIRASGLYHILGALSEFDRAYGLP